MNSLMLIGWDIVFVQIFLCKFFFFACTCRFFLHFYEIYWIVNEKVGNWEKLANNQKRKKDNSKYAASKHETKYNELDLAFWSLLKNWRMFIKCR